MDMDENELNQKFMVYEQQIRQFQEQLNAVERATLDMSSIYEGLDDLKGKEEQEILAPMGRGIFVKAKLLSEKLTVEVGEGIFTEKSIDETKSLIEKQQVKMKNTQKDIESELEKINQEITVTMREFQENKNN
jgi:prefoldin alpha subunit